MSGSAASTAAPLRFTSLALGFFSSGSAAGSSRRERRPSSALAHLVAKLNSSKEVHRSSCIASSSFILTSRTPSEKAEMMASSVTLGILRRALLKRWMYFCRISSGCCLMRRMSLTAGGRSRVPWKLAMKRVRISSQEEIVPGARFRSQVRAPSLSAMGNQFAMTFSSPLAASMPSS